MTQEPPEKPVPTERERACQLLRNRGYDAYAEELEQVPELEDKWRDKFDGSRERAGFFLCADELAEVLADDE